MKKTLLLLIIFTSINIFSQDKFMLETSSSPRFELTEKVWSQTIGDVSVCLWNDDKLSAFTITIDDNNEQDIPFWQQMQKKYGFKNTWFVITEANKQYNVKSWELFNELVKAGNAVQGHDDQNWYDNPTNEQTNTSIKKYRKRLKKTISKIEKHIKNEKCVTYAYPWGQGNVNEAAKHFIASRSAIGLLNPADNINFKKVRSISNPHIFKNDSTRNHYILPLINKTTQLEDVNYYRGWGSTHFHDIRTNEKRKTTDDFLNYLKQKEDKLWISTFPNVAKYAQEYATHQLKVTKNGEDIIEFSLTDDMQDAIFNFPLTVKVRIANNWVNTKATQNGIPIKTKVITYNLNKYALLKVVPDRGNVILTATIDENLKKSHPFSRYEIATLRDDYYVTKTISKGAQDLMKARVRIGKSTAQFPKGDAPHSEWKKVQTHIDNLVLAGLQPIKDYYKSQIDTITIGGIRAIDIHPKNYKKSDKIAFYIHGGAYVVLSADVTLASMLPLAETSGLRIVAIDYTLAPQAKFKQITDEVISFYKGLLKEYDSKNIVIYGDSAGGGLAAGSILKMRDLGIEMPAALVLWSPWSDIDQIGETYFTLADNDPSLVYNNFLENAALAYAPKSEFKNPYVSPVYGDFRKGFPPTLIQVGSKEIFLSNAIRIYRAIDDANIEVKLDVYEGMWHVWQGHYLLPESIKAVENTKKFMFKHLKINQ